MMTICICICHFFMCHPVCAVSCHSGMLVVSMHACMSLNNSHAFLYVKLFSVFLCHFSFFSVYSFKVIMLCATDVQSFGDLTPSQQWCYNVTVLVRLSSAVQQCVTEDGYCTVVKLLCFWYLLCIILFFSLLCS